MLPWSSPSRPQLSPRATFALLVSIILGFLAGSSAPTPLYPLYQAAWGLSPVTVTVVFGIYALAVLAALLVAGSLSDHVGRRPVLLAAAAAQVITMLIFAAADGLGALVAARVLQGLSTGAAAGAVGAGLLDLDRERGTVANAVGPMLGTATGSLVSGLMVQLLPAPTELVYLVLAGLFAAQAVGVVFMPETASRRAGALASLRPRFLVPPAVRRPLAVAAPVLVAAWALAGFYGSLGPALVRQLTGSSALVLGGLALFVLAASGVATVLLTRRRAPSSVMLGGSAALVVGVGMTVGAIATGSLSVLLLGAVIAGAGFGAGFQGGIRTIVPLAAPHERAGVLSVVYVVAYLAMGVPAVLGGLRVVHGGGVLATASEYGLCVVVLAALALIGGLAGRPSRPGRPACPRLARGEEPTPS